MRILLAIALFVLSVFVSVSCSVGDPEGVVTADDPGAGGDAVGDTEGGEVSLSAAEATPEPREPEPRDWLAQVMEVLPASVADSGVWFSNPIPAFELFGAEPVRTPEEWESYTHEQQRAYVRAREGISRSGMYFSMKHAHPDWDETFGFGVWDVSATSETGAVPWQGSQINILLGEFNPATVSQKLLDLGYEQREHLGVEYLTLPEGVRPELSWLRPATFDSEMRNVLVEDWSLITAPRENEIQALLSARAGDTPSLMDYAAFGDLALLAPDPLFVVILGRQVIPEWEERFILTPPAQPEEWGNVGNWETLSVAFNRPSPHTKRIAISLWYAELAAAEKGAAELKLRFEPLEFHPFDEVSHLFEFCADWQIQVFSVTSGTVVEIACQVEEGFITRDFGDRAYSWLVGGLLGHMTK